MEVDLQSLFGLHVTWCAHAQLHSLAENLQLPSYPRHWTRITRALLVSKNRRHLFVTPWLGHDVYCPNLSNYQCFGRSTSISVCPNSNPNCITAGSTAGFVSRSAVRSKRMSNEAFSRVFPYWIAELETKTTYLRLPTSKAIISWIDLYMKRYRILNSI